MLTKFSVDHTMLSSAIRVLIVDDLAVVRSSLKLFIRAYGDLEWVGDAVSGEEAVQLCDKVRPDVVLLDLGMPGLCSVAVLRLILYHSPQTQVVVMTSFQGEGLLQKMLDNGAISCLLKNVSSDDLASAIRCAYQKPRPVREATEPTFSPHPNVPCKGPLCPWGWKCRPTDD